MLKELFTDSTDFTEANFNIKTFFGYVDMFRKESFLWYKLLQLNEYHI